MIIIVLIIVALLTTIVVYNHNMFIVQILSKKTFRTNTPAYFVAALVSK
jgi:hypothetical protein